MAEGIAKSLGADAYSAGSKASGVVNPGAIEVMKEIGIDLSSSKSKGFNDLPHKEFYYVITMGCGDVCPYYPAKEKLDWKIEDPKGKPIEFFRKTRDQIKGLVEELLKEL